MASFAFPQTQGSAAIQRAGQVAGPAGAATGVIPGASPQDPRMAPQPAPSMPSAQTGRGAPQITVPSPGSQPMPRDHESRLDVWRNLLTDFVWSLGSGMSERAAHPRSPGAGIGAAIRGPWELEQVRLKQQNEESLARYREAQEERARVASVAAMEKIAEDKAKLPLELEELFAKIGLTGARTGLTQAQTQSELQPPAEKEIDTYTMPMPDGTFRRVSVMQRSDNSVYERISENETYVPGKNIDPLSDEGMKKQIELAEARAKLGGGRTLYERLGRDAYNRMLTEAAMARANVNPDSVDAYVQGVNSGNVTNLNQIPQVARGLVLGRIGAEGGFVITTTDREAIRKLDMADHLLDQLELLSRRIAEDPGDFESAAILHGMRQAVAGVFAKGIFAEVGVLTDADISRVKATIPGVIGSAFVPGISEEKFKILHDIINTAKNNYSRPVGELVGRSATKTPTTPTTPAAAAPTTGATVPDFIMQGGRLVPNPNKQ